MIHKIKKIIMNLGMNLGSLFPIKNIIILESLPTLTDNAKVLYDYLIKHKYNKNYQIIWFCDQRFRDKLQTKNVKCICVWSKFRKLSFIGAIKYFHYLKNAKYIFYCNRGLHKFNKKSTTVYLGHGLPLKKLKDLKVVSPKVDWVISPSKFIQEVYEEQLNIAKEKIINLGLPRNDTMFNYKKTKRKFDFLNKENEKIILWLPTFRDNAAYKRRDTTFIYPLGIPIIYDTDNLNKLEKYLKERNIILLIKPHPVQDLTKIKEINLKNIKIIYDNDLKRNNISLQEFMFYTDSILTDYSGVYYDALISDKPIGFTIDDFKEYQETRGFPFDNPLDKMAGEKIKNIKELQEHINNIYNNVDKYQEDRKKMLHLFYDNIDGLACERIIKKFNI